MLRFEAIGKAIRIKSCRRFATVLLLTLLMATVGNSATAQQFRIVEDTVQINASDFIGPVSNFVLYWSAHYKGHYFCIFRNGDLYESWLSKRILLVISEDGKDIVEVSLPEDFHGAMYGDLFVRHDTLFLKDYHSEDPRSGWFFDWNAWKWEPLKMVSDIIYDDDQYSIAYLDMGEWGRYTWFIDKKVSFVDERYRTTPLQSGDWQNGSTSVVARPLHPEIKETFNQYLIPEKTSRIIKKDDVYYFIQGNRVDTLSSLKGKVKLCKEEYTYEAAARDEHAFLDHLLFYVKLNTDPIPTLFRFTCEDYNLYLWGGPICDTLFVGAWMTEDNINYLVNTENKTFIAQIEEGTLREKLELGHRYYFFRRDDCYRGENPAPNQCFLQFKEDMNSYGILEIEDSLIHVFHILHNQDSLPHIGTDNIEPLLQYLLNNLNHLTLSQVDSVEKILQGTAKGQFRKLANHYFPDDYQTDIYERYTYYIVIDCEQTMSVAYCVNQKDSVVYGAFFDWITTNGYNASCRTFGGIAENAKQKYAEVRRILTRITGEKPVEIKEKSTYSVWTYGNITVKLYDHGRMVIYLTGK